MTALLRTTTTPQKNSVLPLRHLYPYPYQGLTYFLIILVVFSVNQLFFVFSFPITLFFLLLPFVLFLFNLLYFCYSSSFEASISTFFFLLILHLFSLSTFFFGKDPMILLSCFFLLSFLVSSTLLFFFSVLPIYLVSILSLFLFSVSSPLFYILLMFPFTLSLVLLFVFFLFPVILYFIFLCICVNWFDFPIVFSWSSIVYLFLLCFFVLHYSCILPLFFPSPFHFHPIDYIYWYVLCGVSFWSAKGSCCVWFISFVVTFCIPYM